MATTDEMLRTVLVMQAEILGRLEALEQAAKGADSAMEDRMRQNIGLTHAPTYEDPRLEALHGVDGLLLSDGWANVEAALNDLIKNVDHRSSPS